MILYGHGGYIAGIAALSGLLTTVTIIFVVVYFRRWRRGSSDDDDLATKKPDVAVPPPSETSPQEIQPYIEMNSSRIYEATRSLKQGKSRYVTSGSTAPSNNGYAEVGLNDPSNPRSQEGIYANVS